MYLLSFMYLYELTTYLNNTFVIGGKNYADIEDWTEAKSYKTSWDKKLESFDLSEFPFIRQEFLGIFS